MKKFYNIRDIVLKLITLTTFLKKCDFVHFDIHLLLATNYEIFF